MPRPAKERPISVPIKYYPALDCWRAWITLGKKPDGSDNRIMRQRKTDVLLIQEIRRLEDEYAKTQRPPAPARSPEVGAYLDDWIAQGEARNRWKYLTLRDYKMCVRLYVKPKIGKRRLQPLVLRDWKKLLADIEEDVSAHAAAKTYRMLKSALNDAVREEILDRNLVALLREPVVKEQDVLALTAEEVVKVTAEIGRLDRNRARYEMALALGERQGECLGLMRYRPEAPRTPGDVDLKLKTLTVREKLIRKSIEHGCDDPHACGAKKRKRYPRGLHAGMPACTGRGARHDRYHLRGHGCPKPNPPCPPGCVKHARACPTARGGGLVREKPKTRAGERTQAIPDQLAESFTARLLEIEVDKAAAGDDWEETGYWFTDKFGRPLDPRRDYEIWRGILVRAGIDHARLHAARHTAATMLSVVGTDKRVMMEIMGWAQDQSARYVDVVDEQKRTAAKKVGDLLWPPAEPDPEPEKPADPARGRSSRGKRIDHAMPALAPVIDINRARKRPA